MKWMIPTSLAATAMLGAATATAQISPAQLDGAASKVQPKVITWRRDIHQHPELSNRETRTSKLVADHLKKLGLPVHRISGVTGEGVDELLEAAWRQIAAVRDTAA